MVKRIKKPTYQEQQRALAPKPEWLGMHVAPHHPDNSGGKNPRYGQDHILEYIDIRDRFDDLKIGDVVQVVWVKAYGHSAYIQLEKRNRKSWVGREISMSYSANRTWYLRVGVCLYFVTNYATDERLRELRALWHKDDLALRGLPFND